MSSLKDDDLFVKALSKRDVLLYIVDNSPRQKKNSRDMKPMLDFIAGRKLAENGKVRIIYHSDNQIKCDVCFGNVVKITFKTNIILKKPSYDLFRPKSPEIVSTNCMSCKHSRCSHIAAVLLSLLDKRKWSHNWVNYIDPNNKPITHSGSWCRCGTFQFEVDTSETIKLYETYCSMQYEEGTINRFAFISPSLYFNVPASQYRLKGDPHILFPIWSVTEKYVDYDTGEYESEHTFCKKCGDEIEQHPWPYLYPGNVKPKGNIAIPVDAITSKSINKTISLSDRWRKRNLSKL